MKTLMSALVAASLLAGSSAAFAKSEKVAFTVSTKDVNFADPASVAKFRARLFREIAAQCAPADEIQTGRKFDFKCTKSMRVAADTKIAQLQGSATSQMAVIE